MLGIFQHKKVEYNGLILKGLLSGPKTTRQIAEYVYFNRRQKPRVRYDPRRTKEPNENEVKKIVSIISRKGSRLEELETKNYIFHKENQWHPKPKGTCVALTQFNSISEAFPFFSSYLGSVTEDLQKAMNEQPVLQSLFTTKKSKKVIGEFHKFLRSEAWAQFLKDFTNELIVQGTDLDQTTDMEFTSYLMGKFFTTLLPKLIMKGRF